MNFNNFDDTNFAVSPTAITTIKSGRVRFCTFTMTAPISNLDGGSSVSNDENGTTTTSPPRRLVVDNPMPHRLPEGENAAPLEVIGTTASDKLVIIMVGLPATG